MPSTPKAISKSKLLEEWQRQCAKNACKRARRSIADGLRVMQASHAELHRLCREQPGNLALLAMIAAEWKRRAQLGGES